MSRISGLFIAAAVAPVAFADPSLPRDCSTLLTVPACNSGNNQHCSYDTAADGGQGACVDKPMPPTLKQLDGSACLDYQFYSGTNKCANILGTPTQESEMYWCEINCNNNPSCFGFSIDSAGDCTLCSDDQIIPNMNQVAYQTWSGSKNCKDCADLSPGECDSVSGCNFDGVAGCVRDCLIPDYNPDGTCNNFCIKERMQCKSEDNFHAKQEASAEACQEKVPLGTDAFDFGTNTGKCSLCQTAELVDEGRNRHTPFYAGVRTCNATTTTTLATTVSTTVSTTPVLPVSTMAPSESMTGDVTASQEIAKRLIAKNIRAEVTDAAEDKQVIHSEIPFIGGLLGGITATLLVFVAKRRYASVVSSEEAE